MIVAVIVGVIDTLIVAALVSGNDAVGVADAVNAALGTAHRASSERRTTVNGVDQVHDIVPVLERGDGHGPDHDHANVHGYVHGF